MSTGELKNFADRLRILRKSKGYTLNSLAKEIGVSFSAIANYESGSNGPRPQQLLKLSEVLDVAPAYLMCETDDPTPSSQERMRREIGGLLAKDQEDGRDDQGRYSAKLFPKTWEKVNALMPEMECFTQDEVIAKLVNDRYDEVFPGKSTPHKVPVRHPDPEAIQKIADELDDDEDDDGIVYDVDLTKPKKK